MSTENDEIPDASEQWNQILEEMNESVVESMEKNMQAQAAFVESWTDAFSDSVAEEDVIDEGMEGYEEALEVWSDATEQMIERSADTVQGEDVEPGEFRDIFLQSSNEAFKRIMNTSAFASANGQFIETMLELQQETDDINQEVLEEMGFATQNDVVEIGERIIELERRQQKVEKKIDRVLDAVEE